MTSRGYIMYQLAQRGIAQVISAMIPAGILATLAALHTSGILCFVVLLVAAACGMWGVETAHTFHKLGEHARHG